MRKLSISIILVLLVSFGFNTSVSAASKKKIGICLSGGGALGFAHVGVLQALEDNGIYPDAVSGSSMGAIIGVMYAAGYGPQQIMDIIKMDKMYKTSNLLTLTPSLVKTGISTHDALRSVLHEFIPHDSFDSLKLPLSVCVVNLNTGEYEIKSTGNDLSLWVSASASIPGVFEAIKKDNVFYVDGGLLNNFPAQPLKETCDIIIGVDVLPYVEVKKDLQKPSEVLIHSIRASQKENSKPGRALCNYVIESKAVESWNEFSFEQYTKMYNYGYASAMEYIVNHPDILKYSSKNK